MSKLKKKSDKKNFISHLFKDYLPWSEFTKENNPYECNLEKYCKFDDHDFIGKKALEKIKKSGLKQKMRGVMFGGKPYKPNGKLLPVLSLSKKIIGRITSGIFSPISSSIVVNSKPSAIIKSLIYAGVSVSIC